EPGRENTLSRQSSKTSKPDWRTGTRVVVCKRGQGTRLKAEMQISKPALFSQGFWIVLAIAFCISLGILIGFHGGLHNEAGAIYDSSGGRHAIAGSAEISRLRPAVAAEVRGRTGSHLYVFERQAGRNAEREENGISFRQTRMNPEEQNKALDAWQTSARYWDKYRVLIAQMFAPLTS